MAQALVVVVHRNRQRALGGLLPDHIVVQIGLDRGRRWQIAARLLGIRDTGRIIPDDFIAQVDAFVTYEDRGPGDELLHFMLAFPTE